MIPAELSKGVFCHLCVPDWLDHSEFSARNSRCLKIHKALENLTIDGSSVRIDEQTQQNTSPHWSNTYLHRGNRINPSRQPKTNWHRCG